MTESIHDSGSHEILKHTGENWKISTLNRWNHIIWESFKRGDIPIKSPQEVPSTHLQEIRPQYNLSSLWGPSQIYQTPLKYTGCLCLVTPSCPTFCDSLDCNLPGSSVHEISQQRHWNRLRFPLGDLPNPGIELTSLVVPALQADSLPEKPLGL